MALTRGRLKAVELYVDAVRAMEALKEAEKLEGKTPERTRLLKEAKVLVSERSRPMTGAMFSEAKRMQDAACNQGPDCAKHLDVAVPHEAEVVAWCDDQESDRNIITGLSPDSYNIGEYEP